LCVEGGRRSQFGYTGYLSRSSIVLLLEIETLGTVNSKEIVKKKNYLSEKDGW
jgi:hypothetical protein